MNLDPTQPDPIVGWEDTAVDPYQLGDYLREFQALVDRYGYSTSLYGHFGDGCIHARITFDTRTTEGVATWRQFSQDIAHLVVRFGGSLSGEHGDGQAKAEFLPIMFGENLMQAFRQFKTIWDPESRMNPGKLIDAYKMDENLRFGPDYIRPVTSTTLSFVEDIDGLARSSERCIGMGKCRAESGAMCPSYQASNEERYSTRGRAHLLHEMLRGEVIKDGWNNKEIADSLEHCLSCKACKHECPTQVDIASYKSEFMSEHYKKKKRPLHQYVFGHVGRVLPLLSRFPRVANFFQSGIAGNAAKSVLGISADKNLPKLSTASFSKWAGTNADEKDANFFWFGNAAHTPVVLWSDSVNSHYRPAVLISAVNVLKLAGFKVAVARSQFCCGRPLYEYGFLEQARKQLTTIVDNLYPHLPQDAKLVILEPSCLSVFKDELKRFFNEDKRAIDVENRAMTITAFLASEDIAPKVTLDKGILHLHCHDKASAETHERTWMQQCFSELSEPESGCCGMAGTFGMREQTRSLGQTLFNRKLKPAVDSSDNDVIIVANGFSCNEQFSDYSQRQVLHPVQVIERCL
jgi:Fe-S oxidoreductase